MAIGGTMRKKRIRGPSAQSIQPKYFRAETKLYTAIFGQCDHWRPSEFIADCQCIEGPCPFVGCRHNIYLDVNERTGSIKFNFPDREPWEFEELCSIKLANKHDMTLEEIGVLLNITRERARQIINAAKVRMKAKLERVGLSVNSEEWVDRSGEKERAA
jgi:hypothetical protein